MKVRRALARNFCDYMYCYYGIFDDLSEKAKLEYLNLDVGNVSFSSKGKFKILESFVGFENALKIRRVLLKIFQSE